MNQNQIESVELIQEFLEGLIKDHPGELAARMRALQSAWQIIKEQVKRTQTLAGKLKSELTRVEEELDYLRLVIVKLSDTATKFSVAGPMIEKIYEMERGNE